MPRLYRCPFDGKGFKSVGELEEYCIDNYKDKVPPKYKGDMIHYLYDLRNGVGKCQICGAKTEWNPKLKKYDNLCKPTFINRLKNLPKGKLNTCSEIMRKIYLDNIKNTYGKDNLMDDINYQDKLLKARKIARVTKYKGREITVIGSYEEEFVKVCNDTLKDKFDLECPGPIIKWIPKGSTIPKEHITDFYIKSIDCVVSIKDEGFYNESHHSVVEKRQNDSMKFYYILKDDRNFSSVIELAGLTEIRDFPRIYRQIQKARKNNERYIKYPKNYDSYVNEDTI